MSLFKKMISFLACISLVLSISVQCFAVPYYDVDMNNLNEIYTLKDNEKIVDIIFSHPIILVLLDRDDKSVLLSSNDVGKTWNEIDLEKEYDGFKANGMFRDLYVWNGVHIFGSKDGKMCILHSSSLEGWENVLCDVSKLNGEIINMVSCYDGYKIYCVLDEKLTLINTRSLSYDLSMKDIKSVPENLFVDNNIIVSYTDKNVSLSIDGEMFIPIKLNDLHSVEKCEIYDSDCSSTYITVVYKTKNQDRQALIELSVDNNSPKYEIKEDEVLTHDYDFLQVGEWGMPIIVVKDSKIYKTIVKEDSETSYCKKNDISWVYQCELPDEWAYQDILNMARNGVLTPWTLPEDFKEGVTRELFCKYIYNLIYEKVEVNNNTKNKFSDCNDIKVNAIAELGIINGVGDNKFEPSRKITREEAITVISRVVRLLKLTNKNSGAVKEFNDFEQISSWAKSDVKNMQIMKIINGDSVGNFNPRGNLSVQESLAIISRIFKLMQPDTGCKLCE